MIILRSLHTGIMGGEHYNHYMEVVQTTFAFHIIQSMTDTEMASRVGDICTALNIK